MIRFTPLILLFFFVIKVSAQNIVGNWYGIEKDRLVKFAITKDSLKMQAVNADLTSKGYEEINRKHTGIYQLKDRTVMVFQNDQTLQFNAITFININEKQFFEIAYNGIRDNPSSKDELLSLCKKDTTKLKGGPMLIVSEHHLPVLKKMKSIDQMDADALKVFLEKFVSIKKEVEAVNGALNSVLKFQIATRALLYGGYNPLIDMDMLNKHLQGFFNDEMLKHLIQESFK